MKRILIALALMLLVLPTAAWSNGTPGDPTFDQPYTAGVADGWGTYNNNSWAPGYPVYYTEEAGITGSAQGISAVAEGGVFAVFEAMAGFEYTIGISIKTIGGDVGSGMGSGYFAIDWSGGEDVNNIAWDAWEVNTPNGTWDYRTRTGIATGDKITVFLDAYGPGVTSFDNLTGIGEDYVAPPVPEPGSLLALCTGLVGLVGVIRRRR